MRRFLLLALVCSACGSDPTPVAPTPPPAAACQTNNTASAMFKNGSVDTAMDVFWDGNKVSTLTPGQSSTPLTVAAGVAHHLEFRIANTPSPACTDSSPIPATCGMPLYTCTY
jgi:hypothetical protein